MTIEARLEDGRVLEFPDGTDPQIVQRTVKNVLNVGTGTQGIQETARKQRAQTDIQSLSIPDPQQQEIPQAFREQAQETSAGLSGLLKTGAISTGRGLTKIARALNMAEPETEAEKMAFLALEEERPVTTFAGEVVGESLPFLPAGVGAGAVRGTVPRAIAATGLGAAEGGLIRKGEGASESDIIGAAGVGGAVGGALEIALPVIGRIGGKIVRRVTGKQPAGSLLTDAGTPTPELQSALDRADITFDDLTDAAVDVLRDMPGVEPQQAARKAFLENQGLVDSAAPTTAQITRDATEFQAQQEAAKTSGNVGARLEAQQGVLSNRFDETIAGTGGQPVTSGSPVADHVLNKSTELDNEIAGLYDEAMDRLTDGQSVDLSRTFTRLESMRPSDSLMKGPIKAIEGEAKRLGIIDNEGKSRLATVEESELLRQFSNQLFNSVSDFGRVGLRTFRDFIDEDVTKSAGGDIFNKARSAKEKFEVDLSRSKISKFDRRKSSIVKDILENKINPERLFDETVLAKKYRGSDIKNLKDYMRTGTPEQVTAGKQAFDDLRAETLDYIKNQSFVGPEDAAGVRNLSRAKIEATLKRIGPEKLTALFTGEELAFLRNMANVAKMLEPVRGTALGKGPSAQAVESAVGSLKRRLDKLPALNVFLDLEFDKSAGILKGKPALKKQPLLPSKQDLLRQSTQAGIVAGTIQGDDQQ